MRVMPSKEVTEERRRQVLECVDELQPVGMGDISEKVGFNSSPVLTTLMRNNLLKREKGIRNFRYSLTRLGSTQLGKAPDEAYVGQVAKRRSHDYLDQPLRTEKEDVPIRSGAQDFSTVPSLIQGNREEYRCSRGVLGTHHHKVEPEESESEENYD